jgi:outer membrane murein-binding lipoprotein Lpp
MSGEHLMAAGDVHLTVDLDPVTQSLAELHAKVDALMSQQDEINTDVTELQAAVTAIADEIAALKAANPALDLSGLEGAVAAVQALAPPPAA